MKLTRKILVLALVLVTVLACTLAFASCGNDGGTDTNTNTNTNTDTGSSDTSTDTGNTENDPVIYTVYFQNQNGQPIEGINAQVCLPGGFCLPPKTSDAEGVCKFQYTEIAALEIQVNSVPSGFIKPEGYIPFPEGKTSRVVTIQQNETYTVTASDLHGNRLANILVELYKEEGDELVESAVTEANGRVTFIVNPDKYYAKVSHAYGNGAFTLVNDTDVVSFENSKNAQIQFVVLDTSIDYTAVIKDASGAAVSGATVMFYNEDFLVVGEAETDENGSATASLKNGTYYIVASVDGKYVKAVSVEKNGAVEAEMLCEDVVPGSDKDHPIMIAGNIDITQAGGAQLWYSVPNAQGKTVEITSDAVEAFYNGVKRKPQNGVILFELKEKGEAVFRIDVKSESEVNVTGEIYKLGSLKTPEEIEVDKDYTFEGVKLGEGERYYYSFVADKAGTVKVTTDTENAVISINGVRFKKSVEAGDVVVICFFTEKLSGESVTNPEAEISASLTFGESKAEYSATVKVENESKAGVTVELYYLNGNEYELKGTYTSDENGAVNFGELTETAKYFIKASYGEEYETVNEYTPFGDETTAVVYVTHKRDGSALYPFLVDADSENNTTEVRVEDGKEVWYTLFYLTGATITVDNASAAVEIYTRSGDGEPTLQATLTGDNLSYVLASDYGTTTRVLIKVTCQGGGTVNLTYVAPQIEE
ncbi:MAG: carboxypeptidase regulatory-like domain-containing protein [Clostridia bacterium]|nr:carboxypeptidase regulatory-like domain-containing protein [Clostridia bacterium]